MVHVYRTTLEKNNKSFYGTVVFKTPLCKRVILKRRESKIFRIPRFLKSKTRRISLNAKLKLREKSASTIILHSTLNVLTMLYQIAFTIYLNSV